MIDPSRIEKGEIPLLVILQKIRKIVKLAIGNYRQLKEEKSHNEWRDAFKGVAGGLSLFAKDYHPLNDLDPELFLDWGLERAGNSTGLREALHQLFDSACQILGVEALVIGFDDADTDSTLTDSVLECIRKYLDTPRVMVLVAGDLELYSLLVRQRFAKTVAGKPEAALDLQRSSKQGDRSAQYLRMIDHLEEQYLLKLFPINRRMQLQPLWNVMFRDTYQVTYDDVQKKSLSEKDITSFSVKDTVNSIIKHGLRVKSNSDVALFSDFLLKQPLRSVIQVMDHCVPFLGNFESITNGESKWTPDLAQKLSRSLQALALTSLYKQGVDTDAIAAREVTRIGSSGV